MTIKIYKQIDRLINDILMPATRKILSANELDEIFNKFLFLDDHNHGEHKLSNKKTIKETKHLYHKAFTAWLLFSWREYKSNKSIAEIHMEDEELMMLLNEKQKEIILQICSEYYSFYHVTIDLPKYNEVILQDILMSNESVEYYSIVKYDRSICNLELNTIIFAKIVNISGENIIFGQMPVAICDKAEIEKNNKLEQLIAPLITDNHSYWKNSNKDGYIMKEKYRNELFNNNLINDLYEPILRRYYFYFINNIISSI